MDFKQIKFDSDIARMSLANIFRVCEYVQHFSNKIEHADNILWLVLLHVPFCCLRSVYVILCIK